MEKNPTLTSMPQRERLDVVAAALVDGAGRILLARRAPGREHQGEWEFPGGKVEPGERPEAALARELAEELGVTVDPADFTHVATAIGARANGGELALMLYRATRWQGEPQPLDAAELAWAAPGTLLEFDLVALDWPLAEALLALG